MVDHATKEGGESYFRRLSSGRDGGGGGEGGVYVTAHATDMEH